MYIDPHSHLPLTESPKGLINSSGEIVFPLVNGVYEIAPVSNYTANFGFQWNTFKKTQLDKFSEQNQSKERFFSVTGWDKENLEGKNILELGCGAGRFTDIALNHTKCNLYSADYSNAVYANHENNAPNPRLKLFHASVYELPFKENTFDKVFCFGVLQHTPNPKETIASLHKVLKPGGELIVDFYPYKGFWTKINAKYILRPFLKKLSNERLLKLIKNNINWMISLSQFFIKIKLDRITNRFIPICDIKNTFPATLSKEQLKEWATLDTFDMYSPAYDSPQKVKTIVSHFTELKTKNIWGGFIKYGGNNEVALVKGIKQ